MSGPWSLYSNPKIQRLQKYPDKYREIKSFWDDQSVSLEEAPVIWSPDVNS